MSTLCASVFKFQMPTWVYTIRGFFRLAVDLAMLL